MAIGMTTFQDNTLQEDIVDAIYNVDYKSTPFISRIGESVATNTLGLTRLLTSLLQAGVA